MRKGESKQIHSAFRKNRARRQRRVRFRRARLPAHEGRKEEKRRENAQEALRNALVQSLAAEVSKRQLLAGQDPLALIDRLISSTGQYRPQPQNRQIDRQVENDIARLLEYDDRDNGRER